MKILVAEDDLTSNLMLTQIFEEWGYEVISTYNGDHAWDILDQDDAPQIAVLDWIMPGLEGVEVCRKAKERDISNQPYLIILTGRAGKEDIVRGLESGADDYITKPFDENELKARIRVADRMVRVQANLSNKIKALQDAMDEIKILKGFIPICSNCKQIRDDDGYWERIDLYIQKHSEASFTHSICPDCTRKLYPGLNIDPDL